MLYGMKDCANLTWKDRSGNIVLYSDYARTTSLEFTSDQVYAYGKSSKRVRWDLDREATMTFETELFDLSVLAVLFGTSLVEGTNNVSARDLFSLEAGELTGTLSATPATDTLAVYQVDPEATATHIQQLTLASSETPASGEYYIDDSNVITVSEDDFAEGGSFAAYYLTSKNVQYFTVNETDFPEAYEIWGQTTIRSVLQEDTYVDFYLPNAKPQSNVTLTMSADDVATLSITVDCLADGNGDMMTWSMIEDDEEEEETTTEESTDEEVTE